MKTLTKNRKNVLAMGCLAFTFLLYAQQPITAQDHPKKIIVQKTEGLQEYSSTLDFNDNRKQLLLASQNYQTNYAIYASIKKGASSEGKDYKTIEKITFEIVNYKPT